MHVIGVAGGSGSGKTYLAEQIVEELPENVLVFPLDRYYRPFDDMNRFERMQINFDRPETLDWPLVERHIEMLQRGQPIQMPVYSYEESTRKGYEMVEPKPLVVVEGIFALYQPALNDEMDLKVFVDPAPDIRAVRRLKRDVVDRDRPVEFAARQYLEKTRPMHEKYVEPTRGRADVVLDGIDNATFVETVTEFVEEHRHEDDVSIRSFF